MSNTTLKVLHLMVTFGRFSKRQIEQLQVAEVMKKNLKLQVLESQVQGCALCRINLEKTAIWLTYG